MSETSETPSKMVTVYEHEYFDARAGHFLQAPRPATLAVIEKNGWRPLLETALEIDEQELDANGFRKRADPEADWQPAQNHGTPPPRTGEIP